MIVSLIDKKWDPFEEVLFAKKVIRMDKQDLIRNTNNDALQSKLSAISTGYLNDEYAKLLGSKTAVIRKQPIINRGENKRVVRIRFKKFTLFFE